MVDDGSGGRVAGVMAPWFRHWGLRPVLVESHDDAARFAKRCHKPAHTTSSASAAAGDNTAAESETSASGDLLPELSVVLCAASKAVERDMAGLVSAMDALGARPCVVSELTPFQASPLSCLFEVSLLF